MSEQNAIVIVESPAKGKTIERYLGSGFHVVASFGHVRDLPKSTLGIDVEHNYTPKYIIPPKSKKTVTALKTAIKDASAVYLATDLDREGEAIAWHIMEALGLEQIKNQKSKIKNIHRITFTEITKSALTEALKHPRQINMNLVNSQQARRALDRLVGYTLSPFLWKKVYRGLSAGRVQSVAVRLVVEREREIEAFKAQEYWTVEALLTKQQSAQFSAQLVEREGKKLDKLAIASQEEAQQIKTALQGAAYRVRSVEVRNEKRYPLSPFTTSTLQQEAANRLRYSAKRTMRLAQDLYEDGHITYMRTDSVAIAQEAQAALRTLITKQFGAQYLPEKAPLYAARSKHAQEAHEAIRPTDCNLKNVNMSPDHEKLYDLIWRRTVASQMRPAELALTTVLIDAATFGFRANGTQITFDGCWKVWPRGDDKPTTLPHLETGDLLKLEDLALGQHFTEPPPRYTEATLVKALEEREIGRPSTYAPILSTIQDRGYVRLEERKFFPQEVGTMVTDLLVEHFPEVVDYDFTAKIEDQLDEVAEGAKSWTATVDEFYTPFAAHLKEKEQTVEKKTVVEELDRKCPESGHPLVIRMGRFGKFIACTGFPECRYSEPILEPIGIKCPECGTGDVIERRTKKKRRFWGCSRYPECKWASWQKPKVATSS